MDIWSQQEREGGREFQAFTVYRDMSPAIRTVKAAAEVFYGDECTENTINTWRRYSSRHNWKKRALAWDKYRDEQACEAEVEEIREMTQRQLVTSRHLQEIADIGIKRELEDLKEDESKRLNPQLLLQIATQSASMERVVRGEPSDIVKQAGAKDVIKIEWGAPNAEEPEPADSPAADTASGPDGDHQ